MDGTSRLLLCCLTVFASSFSETLCAQEFPDHFGPPIQVIDYTDLLSGGDVIVIQQTVVTHAPNTSVPAETPADNSGKEITAEFEAEPAVPEILEPVSHQHAIVLPRLDACDGDGRFLGTNDAYGFDPTGYRFEWTPNKWAKVGGAVRSSFNSQNLNTFGGGGNYFTVDNARLLTSGQVTKYIGFELNSDVALARGATAENLRLPSSIDLLDAIAKFETGELVNFWAGQFLAPSDRSNIDGPFFVNGWEVPFTSNYPAVFQGRQIGAVYWGQIRKGQLKWSIGAFDGTGATLQSPYSPPMDAPPNVQGNIQFDGRVTLNLLDPEPGYYHQSSYYGKKDILAIGYAFQMQHHATGTEADPHDFLGMNIDVLFEKKLANNGVMTFEGAAYRYDDQDLTTSRRQGTAGLLYGGYLLPYVLDLGPASGRFRPFVRYMQYNYDYDLAAAGRFNEGLDVGTEYVMNGPNARLTAVWSQRDVVLGDTLQIFRLGAQVIF